MTKEENIATLNEHLEHWKRLLSEKICDQSEGEKTNCSSCGAKMQEVEE